MSDQHIFEPGDKFSNYYEIDSLLEKGHASIAYKARNTRMNHPVTIRVFSAQLDSEVELEVFELEARALIRLNHPNIVRFYHYGVFEQMPFIVTENIDGISLRSKISEEAPMPIADASRLAIQICSGLQYAHKFKGADGDPQPIYHRDLTPENIMLGARDVVRITDFRLAQINSDTDKGDPYIAPEQINGYNTTIDEKTDIYLLGLIICEMLSSESLFGRKNFEGQFPEEPNLIKATSPTELLGETNEILQKCLAEDPANRYDSMDDLGIALGSLQQTATLIQKASNYDVEEKYDLALETWRKASSYLPNNLEIPKRGIETEVKSLLLQAETQKANGKIEEALEIWQHILTLNPENTAALRLIEFGKLHLEINQLTEIVDQQKEKIQQLTLAKDDADLAKENIERDLISKSDHVDRLEVDLGSFPEQVRDQEEEIEKLTQARKESDSTIARLQTEIGVHTRQVQELTQTQTNLESVKEELEAQLENNTDSITKLEDDVGNYLQQVQERETKITELTQAKEESDSTIERLQTEIGVHTQQVQELTQTQTNLESVKEELEAQLENNTDSITKLEDDVESQTNQIQEKEKQILELTQAKEESDLAVEKLQAEIDTQTQKAQHLTQGQTELESASEELQSQLDAKTELIAKLEDDVATYSTQILDKEQQIQGLTQAKRDADSEVKKSKNKIDQQEEKYQSLIENQAKINSDKEAIEEHLEIENEKTQTLEKHIENQLQQTQELEAKIEKLTQDKGETNSSVEKMQAEIDTQAQHVQRLTQGQTELESASEELQSQLDAKTELIAKLEDSVKNHKQQINDKEQQILESTQAKAQAEDKFSELQNSFDLQTQQVQDLITTQLDTEVLEGHLNNTLEVSQKRIEQFEADIDSYIQQINEKDMLLEELNKEQVELKEEIKNSDRMLQNAATMYKKQNKTLKEAKIELRKRQSQDVISR